MTSITIVADDNATEGFEKSHGFALYIEHKNHKILFDTGQDVAFLKNCKTLNVDFDALTDVVLSHGHYDHGGNLAYVLYHAPDAKFYAHENYTANRYSIKDGFAKYVGLSAQNKNATKQRSNMRCHLIDDKPLNVAKDIMLTGYVSRATGYEDTGGPFYYDKKAQNPDDIPDDLALYVETDKGLVICLGCCHSGMINTIEHVLNNTQTTQIAAVIGGMNLANANENRLNKTMAALKKYNIDSFIPCHCTGDTAQRLFAKNIPNTTKGAAGQVWRF